MPCIPQVKSETEFQLAAGYRGCDGYQMAMAPVQGRRLDIYILMMILQASSDPSEAPAMKFTCNFFDETRSAVAEGKPSTQRGKRRWSDRRDRRRQSRDSHRLHKVRWQRVRNLGRLTLRHPLSQLHNLTGPAGDDTGRQDRSPSPPLTSPLSHSPTTPNRFSGWYGGSGAH
ncbi:hypothetical protein J6590_000611 [Homalodisca vitripennis]|nr:hypothetical protein J6590_000611 [Homalodisca vitripennis]